MAFSEVRFGEGLRQRHRFPKKQPTAPPSNRFYFVQTVAATIKAALAFSRNHLHESSSELSKPRCKDLQAKPRNPSKNEANPTHTALTATVVFVAGSGTMSTQAQPNGTALVTGSHANRRRRKLTLALSSRLLECDPIDDSGCFSLVLLGDLHLCRPV
jgi:hypothetical protein